MSESPTGQQPPAPETPPSPAKRPRKWRRRLKWVGAISLVLVVLMGGMMSGAEYYTAKPQFCGTCHIMAPYYESWSKDVHSIKADAACVDCHYAPGEHHTFRAKFRGLSQVASYFSGRAGAGRPKAHVNDASCLTSGCHGDHKFMDKPEHLGNVTFVHAAHLDPDGKIAVENNKKLADLQSRLAAGIGTLRLAILEQMARPVETAEERNKKLSAWIAAESLGPYTDDILAYGEMLHTQVRLAQLAGLKCASCHQFNTSLSTHFAVARTTCYTCHFLNEPFNANTGRCLTCHEPPTSEIPIHAAEAPSLGTPTSAPTPIITMNHSVVLANNVNCISCHSDLIHGAGEVTRRDCQNCHDQERYLKDLDHPTTQVVEDYHRVHAAAQRARCNDCHRLIEHKLLPMTDIHEAVSLLSPVRQDCQNCHPSHHREQVEMLLGQGGFVQGITSLPNPMTGSRANCRACHTARGADPKDEAVITGTLESCRGCHGQEYVKLFTQWKEGIAARLKEAQDLLASTEQRLAAAGWSGVLPASQPAPERPGVSPASRPVGTGAQPINADLREAIRLVDRARANIHLVATANGIHNKNYAMALLDQAIQDLDEAGRRLGK